MNNERLKLALILSLLFNVSVVGAVLFQAYRGGHGLEFFASPHSHTSADTLLRLSPEQSKLWHETEIDFMHGLTGAWRDISAHRERMIREIFSGKPDPATIEAERIHISALQEAQQKQVIAQLMREREMLDEQQRRALADFLIQQQPGAPMEDVLRLHRD